jgi:hypothetical protein
MMGSVKKVKHTNSIIEYQDFLTPESCEKLINYFNTDKSMWMETCFYNSSVMNLLDPLSKYNGHGINEEYFKNLRQELWALAEDASGTRLNNLTFSAARWLPGAYADPHSDNSELDGTPNAWQDNKFVTIIYLNDNYQGGELVFNYHNISIYPSTGTVVAFDPGIINVHSVSKITSGERYTMLASWDYANVEYTEEQLEAIRLEKEAMKPIQQKQREEWKNKNNAMED